VRDLLLLAIRRDAGATRSRAVSFATPERGANRVRSIPASYDELAADLLDSADLLLEERAAEDRERELERLLGPRTVLVDGIACLPRVRGDVVIVSAKGAKLRPLGLASAEAAVALGALEALEPRAAPLLAELRRGRARIRLLRDRARLREELREVERRRDALHRLREVELRAAEKLRRRLARRERLAGRASEDALERPVREVAHARAQALAGEARRLRDDLERCEKAIFQAPPARGERGDRLLADLRALAQLLEARVAIEYRRLERGMLQGFRALAFREGLEGAAAAADGFDRRAFLGKLAFLMAKANFSPLPREDLERGFEIGPAPGVRLFVPLEGFEEAYFFARGTKLEPLPAGRGAAPRFEKFAFCLLRDERSRPRAGRRGRSFRRLRAGLARRVKHLLAPRVEEVVDYARSFSKAPPPEVAVDPPIAIKLFRDVRLGECGLVLPGAAIRYRLRDILLVGLGAAGGVWSKIAQRPFAALLAPRLALSIFLVSAFRGLLGMRRSRLTLDKLRDEYENRHLQATRMNAVEYFLREAAETDGKEVLVAYVGAALEALAARHEDDARWRVAPRPLLARVETWLRARTRAAIRFDMEDALGSLEGIGLVLAPGFYAPGEAAPDYFDARLIGESFQLDAEILLARPEAPDAARARARPGGLEEALARGAARAAAEVARREAGRPPLGRDPLTNAPRWLPLEGEAVEGERRFPAPELDLEALGPALRRLRRDLRAKLGLEDGGDAGEAEFAGRFTL
jgi:hypothetical protein